jgi:hypothetical protein
LLAEAEKARFWKRLKVRRAANMTAMMRGCGREEEGERENPVKEIGAPQQFPSSRLPSSVDKYVSSP